MNAVLARSHANTLSGLRIIRESDIEEQQDDEIQRQVHHVETGVEKAEEVEFHLQAVINASNAAALGAQAQQSYIPTPDVVRAKGVKYEELYPQTWRDPATNIRFSSTVEECIGVPYCMDDNDEEFLGRLNQGKDFDGRDRKDKLGQCTEDVFEEVMSIFEETSARLQPFATVDNAPILSLEEIERSQEEEVLQQALKWFKPIYGYWTLKKGNRPMMPTIKVRVLDTASEADDADPYVCFRRREVRQTRKTRGRDAQVVEKLKKLRLELEQGRQLVKSIVDREQLKADSLVADRKLFNERKQIKEVVATKGIQLTQTEKGELDELLVNQKPATKPSKARADGQRPATIRIRSGGEPRPAAQEFDGTYLDDVHAENERMVDNVIDARKEQHKKWNLHWIDDTKRPITPPADDDGMPGWAPFPRDDIAGYPSPPPSLPSHNSQDGDDVDMKDAPPQIKVDDVDQAMAGAEEYEPDSIFHIPGAYPESDIESDQENLGRFAHPACRLRIGRGGRCFLESRKRKPYGQLSRGVVSDSESDDDEPDYFSVSDQKTFDYRAALNNRPTRPDMQQTQQPAGHGHQRWASGDQGRPGSSAS